MRVTVGGGRGCVRGKLVMASALSLCWKCVCLHSEAPSDGVFGRFDLAALLRLPHLKSLLLLLLLLWFRV